MTRLKTKIAEQIYSVLEKYAEASNKYYDREGFIFCFGVIPDAPSSFELECMDGKSRSIQYDGSEMIMIGKGADRVNSIIKKIISNEHITS
jgi:hypothetical protein